MATVVTERHAAGVYRFPSIRWSAVFGGWLVATGLAWLMYVLGLAVGFTAIDASDLGTSARALGIGTVIWLVLTWAVSLFLGGMFASWLDGTTDAGVGTLHGVAVWALATTVSVVLVAIGFSNVVQGGASLVRAGAATMAGAAGAAGMGTGGTMDSATGALQAELKQQIAETLARSAQGAPAQSAAAADSTPSPAAAAGGTAPSGAADSTPSATVAPGSTAQPGDTSPAAGASAAGGTAPQAESARAPTGAAAAGSTSRTQVSSAELRRAMEQIDNETTAAVATELLRGNTEQAKTRLAAGTTLTRADVDQVVQGVSQQVDRYREQAKEAADRAAGYTSMAMWALFFSTLVALLAAALGGWMGSGNVERVYDTRL
jgi:hypothetical protein